MSKYKVGDKVILTVTGTDEIGCLTYYVLNGNFNLWGQSIDNAIQIDLPCRPCSIYGNKPCMRGDYACLKNISPEQIVEKVEAVIRLNKKAE